MSKKKKKWETPKLICLYRGRPEEAVLGHCKTVGQVGTAINDCVHPGGGKPCQGSTTS